MSTISKEVVSINSYDTSLIRLSDICKNSIYHSWKKCILTDYSISIPSDVFPYWEYMCINIQEFVEEQLLHKMHVQSLKPLKRAINTLLIHVEVGNLTSKY